MVTASTLKQIEKIVKSSVSEAFLELTEKGKVKIITEQETFKRVEQILYSYGLFKTIIAEKQEQIGEVKRYGAKFQSKSIVEYQNVTQLNSSISIPQDVAEELILDLEDQMKWLQKTLYKIDFALSKISNDKSYIYIEEYYFNDVSRKSLSEKYNVDVKKISKDKNKLVRTLAIHLFPKETSSELF